MNVFKKIYILLKSNPTLNIANINIIRHIYVGYYVIMFVMYLFVSSYTIIICMYREKIINHKSKTNADN
jgi:hypothetical protein